MTYIRTALVIVVVGLLLGWQQWRIRELEQNVIVINNVMQVVVTQRDLAETQLSDAVERLYWLEHPQ